MNRHDTYESAPSPANVSSEPAGARKRAGRVAASRVAGIIAAMAMLGAAAGCDREPGNPIPQSPPKPKMAE
jgi:hypothetical protein